MLLYYSLAQLPYLSGVWYEEVYSWIFKVKELDVAFKDDVHDDGLKWITFVSTHFEFQIWAIEAGDETTLIDNIWNGINEVSGIPLENHRCDPLESVRKQALSFFLLNFNMLINAAGIFLVN